MAVATARIGTPEEYVRDLWKLLAFLGRYGHQPVDVCLDLPTMDLHQLASGVGEIMEEESNAMRSAADA